MDVKEIHGYEECTRFNGIRWNRTNQITHELNPKMFGLIVKRFAKKNKEKLLFRAGSRPKDFKVITSTVYSFILDTFKIQMCNQCMYKSRVGLSVV